jgi:MFS family permease
LSASSGRAPWFSILFLTAIGVITAGQIFKLAPAMPYVGMDLDLTLVERGWLFSTINLTGTVLGVVAGSVVDAYGTRRMLIGALIVIAVASLLGSQVQTFISAIGLRVVEGMAILAAFAALPAIIIAITPPRQRPMALSIWVFFMPVGAALATFFGGLAINTFGWRPIWQVSAALSLIAAGLVAFRVRPPARHAPVGLRALLRGALATVRHPPAKGFFLIMLMFAALHGAFIAWLPSFLIDERDMSAGRAGTVAGVIIVLNVCGNALAGWLLTHRLRCRQVLLIAGAVTLLTGTGMLSSAAPDGLRIPCAVLFSAVCGMIPATVYAAVPDIIRDPRFTSTMNGLIIQGGQSGHLLGPPLLAWLVARSAGDWSVGAWLYATFSLGIIAIALWLRRAAEL